MNFSLQTPPPPGPGPASAGAGNVLPPPPRPPRRRASLGKRLLVGVVLLALVGAGVLVGVPGAGQSVRRLFASSTSAIVPYKVAPTRLQQIVTERGNLESSNSRDVYNQVEGTTTIIEIVPEGTFVKKDQVVCRLDSSSLKDSLTNQIIATKQADASYQNAKLTREVAEIAVKEYEKGTYQQELETLEGDLKLAEANLTKARERFDWTKRMLAKGYVAKAQMTSEEQSLANAEISLARANTALRVLKNFTREKNVKELQSDVEKAKADELAKEQTLDLEKTKEAKLRKQIENCELKAPLDGIVVYANDPNRFGGSQQPQIDEGASVRERQKIFSIPDITQMQVNTKIHESKIDLVKAGQSARIRVDSMAGVTLEGTVKDVQPMPDQTSFFNSDVKLYTSHVTIDKSLPALRPGMSAQVEIMIQEKADVLCVPVQAILEFKGKTHVYVQAPDDGVKPREVTLGLSNDKLVEVTKGLKAGEVVAMNPTALMSDEEKREAFGPTGKEGEKKGWANKKGMGKGATGKGAGPGGMGGNGAAGKGAAGKGARKGAGQSAADRAKFMKASPEERRKMLEARGLPPEMIDQIMERAANGGGFGPPGGGPPGMGGGPPGGGFGGGPSQ